MNYTNCKLIYIYRFYMQNENLELVAVSNTTQPTVAKNVTDNRISDKLRSKEIYLLARKELQNKFRKVTIM